LSDTPGLVVGIDIGGTFTDFALLDARTGHLVTGKCLTTPDDPSRGLLHGVDAICRAAGIRLCDLERISHATTLVANAIIERRGATTGLLVTDGFRDVLLMGRESRYDHYDFKFDRPEPLVPRRLIREVDERMAWSGGVLRDLELANARDAIRSLVGQGVRALAVCLLHAYRNPSHERAIRQLVRSEFPQLDIAISSDVAPELREYERTSTTVSSAYVSPIVRAYLVSLDDSLRARGFRRQVQVMLSNGGICSAAVAGAIPIQLVESGPAAGALAASFYARQRGIERALAFDMGGTTAKLCAIEGGKLTQASAFEVARARRFKRGSGLPLLIPVIELMEIGAGGGSIAHVDHLGLLKVGPHSAGANPGPAAYGLGGCLPTVTDADLVLGYIDPARFLGGDMPLDAQAAARAVEEHVATPLRLEVVEAAWGIFSVVNETMVAAARRYTAERAIDTLDATLITFGGAAPIHAWQVARILGIHDILYPFGAGVTSAVGLCIAAPVVNLSRSYVGSLDQLDWPVVAQLYDEMEARAAELLTSAGAAWTEVTLTRSVEMRYQGQGFEVEVVVDDIELRGTAREQVRAAITGRFADAYTRSYGRTLPGGALEALTWRLKAEGRPPQHELALKANISARPDSVIGRRRAYFGPTHGFVDCPLHDRYRLAPGSTGTGPALIQERETTLVLDVGARWQVDEQMNLRVTL